MRPGSQPVYMLPKSSASGRLVGFFFALHDVLVVTLMLGLDSKGCCDISNHGNDGCSSVGSLVQARATRRSQAIILIHR